MRRRPLLAPFVLAFASHACAGAAVAPPTVTTAASASTRTAPPTVEELKNATFAGLDERLGAVTLTNGRWMGAPPAPGAASRPIVMLQNGFRVVGDVDGDGLEEALVGLTYSSGGSGSWSFLAVMTGKDGTLRNVTTLPLGDRVQVRSARIEGRRLLASGVRAGEKDPACCPGELVDWQWTPGDRLNPLSARTTGRLSVAALAGTEWKLEAWDDTKPVDGSGPAVTLTYDAGRVTGSSGCNRYVAAIESGAMPGEVKVGPLAGTRMACPEPQSSVESRFLDQLAGARTFSFVFGRLALSYTRADGSRGTMLFHPITPPGAP